MISKTLVEDEIIVLLKAGLPAGVTCGFLPSGTEHEKALMIRTAAVWVVYAGADADKPQTVGRLVQRETWHWSVLVVAKNYRSPDAAGEAALDLLDAVIEILAGREVSAGRIYKIRDSVLSLPREHAGMVGYEAVFAVEPYLLTG